ncbi:probable E3 ubiquitin-protein ligase XERICO [Humulus lupulus]|uniref:probable E3 ubiquitin-protein ligase XERICO n=1 Tax=Humulus lupulus TaxID=3486 RepID=UPI002B4148AD|nr:probable E3 ubiquitin-protein ligase XERICO [Humulus lupulus]
MAALSKFFSNLYTMSLIFFTLFVLEILTLIRSVIGSKPPPDKRVITTAQYLKLIEERNPATCFKNHYCRAWSPKPEMVAECRVCLSEFEDGEKIRKLQCDHVFHKDCLDTWLQQYCATCPLCREKVLPDDVVASYRRMRNQVEYDGNEEELIFLLSAIHGNSFHRIYF